MIRKSGYRFSLATNAKRLRGESCSNNKRERDDNSSRSRAGWRSPEKMSTGRAADQPPRSCKSGGFDFREPDIFLIKPGHAGALRDQCEHGIEGRGWNARQPSHFLNHV